MAWDSPVGGASTKRRTLEYFGILPGTFGGKGPKTQSTTRVLYVLLVAAMKF